jgi:TNF receptor-associated factor 4
MLIHTGKREIEALRVKCSSMERGCEWVGTVGTLEEHVATCGFTLVPCPKQCRDDTDAVKHFMKKDLDKHLKNDCPNRDHKCKHCGEKATYTTITEAHDKVCIMKPVPCPNNACRVKRQRQHVSGHVSKCPHTVTPCKYEGIGCNKKMKRKDMAAHEEDDQFHLHMALETVASQQCAISKLQQTMEDKIYSLQVTVNTLRPKIFVLIEYQNKRKAGRPFKFSPFYTHPNGYHMALRVDANGEGDGEGTHVSVFAPILEGEHNAELKWPFIGVVMFTLLNQLEDKNHHTLTLSFDATDNARVGSAWGLAQFIPHSALVHDQVKNTQYLKDDTLYFRMSVKVADCKPWLTI